MKTELWGTFSVKDHLRERPFLAEVLLYDRLIIPRPPTIDEEKPRSGEHSQFGRWFDAKWEPGKLRQYLDILGDLAIELPWNDQARQDWEHLYQGKDMAQRGALRNQYLDGIQADVQLARQQNPAEAPFFGTAGVIASYIHGELKHKTLRKLVALTKTPGVEVEPVVAYNSYAEFEEEQSLLPAGQDEIRKDLLPYGMFGWEFFVPEDTEKSDQELLSSAVKLASRQDFREVRQYFQDWIRQLHQGGVDLKSAQEKMLKLLQEYQTFTRLEFPKTVVRYAVKVAPVLAPIAGSHFPKLDVPMRVGVGASSLMVDWLLPKKEPDARIRPAAVVHDARQFFGKKG